ncbi:uncharacterized protein M421DRAFT_103125 [Didymella exigua CBS 183.55]|uniref:Uncharacterized protein n=1 Tax=Didymella exigua CBS 183.55 TaxID=1150837 RepID=A0A6A5RIG9_9PLEO|nr:uncharacterized protein M421DRAFT_103125 [Didymella exigua CBS 183.55]KAF1925387.1 hypothetical protein M421DRAFT_103125 [Didymella exigua CBS 183.55]
MTLPTDLCRSPISSPTVYSHLPCCNARALPYACPLKGNVAPPLMAIIDTTEKGHMDTDRAIISTLYPYAILSHTWLLSNRHEVTYEDFVKGQQENKPIGYAKIRFCAEKAAADGLEYFWVDTCCINKANSEELYEAITKMFSWYRKASKCYAYLSDVSAQDSFDPVVSELLSTHAWEPAFRGSRWFNRGWTLQELLAPPSVEFYSAEGIHLGDRASLEQCIYEITGIPREALHGRNLSRFTVEERMRWSKDRETKRKEDKAYCLLGIFDVFMIHMYGEGEHNAFDRLRVEIGKKQAEITRQDHIIAALPFASGAAFDSHNNEHQPKCLPRTRTEILEEIDKWVNTVDQRCMCWLNSVAGSGKSTIARTLATHYDSSGKLGASFFFSRDSGDLSNSIRFVTSLARQLATNVPSVKRYICQALSEQRSISDLSLREQWSRLILKPLSELERKICPCPLVFVIDALDECDNDRDAREIFKVLATAKTLINVRLRIFISSRPELPKQSGFKSMPELQRHTLILQEEPRTRVNRDIKLLFESYFQTIRQECGLSDEWPESSVVKALVDRSGGLFAWASTACRFIQESPQQSQKHISMLLERDQSCVNAKRQLDQLYSIVLRSAISRQTSTSSNLSAIIGPIVVLCSPLSIEALAKLLDRSLSDVQATLASLRSIFRLPTQVSAPIRLHHTTFRDYLLNEAQCTVPSIWIDQPEIHKRLADSCVDHMSRELPLAFLQFSGSHFAYGSIHNVPAAVVSPALHYACLHWIEHYRRGRAQLRDRERAHTFIENSFHLWVQAMNLIGKGPETGTLLRIYQSLLTSALNERQLKMIVIARQCLVALQPAVRRMTDQNEPLVTVSPPLTLEAFEKLKPSSWHLGLQNAEASTNSWKDIKDNNNYVNDVSFTPDGTQIASGSNSEVIRLWYVNSMKTVRMLEDNFTEKVSSVRISPDGTKLAAGSDDSTLKLWDLETGKVLQTLEPKAGWVNSVQFAPSGNILASGSMEGKIVLWDTATGQKRTDFDNQGRCVNSVSFSPDGSLLVTGSDDDVVRLWTLWNITTGKQTVFRGHRKKVTSVSFCPNLRVVASGSEDMTIRVWDVLNGDQLRTLRDHKSGLNAVAFSADGKLLASSSFDDEVRLWETKTWSSTLASNDNTYSLC